MEQKVATTEKKTIKRGLSTARGTVRLKFTHSDAIGTNGLFLAHLDSVQVTDIKIGEDKTGMPSFNGLTIPRLSFTFASNDDDANKRRYITLSFTPVESNVNTIPGGSEEWKVNSIFDWLLHILNVFKFKGREMTDEEAEALSLPFEDFDENREYKAVEPETVVNGWRVLFENVANMLNTGRDGKPVYNTADGKIIVTWIKLLRCIKNPKKGWVNVTNGDLAFPTFVGEGCIEIYKQNVLPVIKVEAHKESIIPKVFDDKPKTPNMPNNMNTMMGNAPMMGGIGGDVMADMNNAAADDMPF